MSRRPSFGFHPWELRESELDLEAIGQNESIFALSNGHIGLRGNLDEGEPHFLPGSYLNSFYENYPLPYTDVGYAYPKIGQTIVNVTNGKVIRLLVEDEPFDVRYGRLLFHQRVLDMRGGFLRRQVEWESPSGMAVRITSTRIVSFAQRALAAILYEVEPVDRRVDLVVQSELVANEPIPLPGNDPRLAPALGAPLNSEYFRRRDHGALLIHSTSASQLKLAASMDHIIDCPARFETGVESEPDLGRLTVATRLEVGQTLRVVKFLAYGWSGHRTVPALRDQVDGALAAARLRGWQGVVDDQREYLDQFWRRSNVEIEGDEELQQALNFGLFHVLQSAARAERRGVPAKGLTGSGYEGHTFWDSETFLIPMLISNAPEAARDALRWRHSTLDAARKRATLLGLPGAAFPWRTIDGRECSGYWPAGTAAFHINADIADAVARYCRSTEDREFERETGLEILVETARLWMGLGHHDDGIGFRIDGVTGPDEYTAVVDNNVYTNLMAQANLFEAVAAARRHPKRAAELGVKSKEIKAWRAAAEAMVIPYDEALGVHPQSEGFTRHEKWNFEATRPDQYPLLLHFHYFDIYRRQVVKQADLELALYLRGDAFTLEEKTRNFAYYEAITVRDSSLSSATQAVVAAEVGHLDLAYQYLGEAALVDLHNLHHNARDGLHLAAMAGAWQAVVAGFGGMRDYGGVLSFAPRLPKALSRIDFRITFKGRLIQVNIKPRKIAYTLLNGGPIEILHGEKTVKLEPESTVECKPLPTLHPEPVHQPFGREPYDRASQQLELEAVGGEVVSHS